MLFPSRGLFVLALDSSEQIGADGLEPEFAAAIARAYNDWLHDFCRAAPERLFGAAMVAPHDVAVGGRRGAPLRRASTASRRSSSRPARVRPPALAPPRLRPALGRVPATQASPVCFHGGGRTSLTPDFSLEIFADRLMMWHTFNQPLGVMTAAVSLCGGGVLERFPELRVGAARGQLLVGAVAAAPARRAPGVGRLVRGARPHA